MIIIIQEKEQELEGVTQNGQEDMYTLLEFHMDLDLEGYEDVNPDDGEPTGIKLPYVITVDTANNEILSSAGPRLQDTVDPTTPT